MRFFIVLVAFHVVSLVVSNVTAGKLIALGPLMLQAADLIFPMNYVMGDVFTEVYGFCRCRKVIWLGFACSLFATLMFTVMLWLPHPECWHDQAAYETVFATTPRIFAASLLAYLTGELANALIMDRMRKRSNGRFLWVRTIGSSVVGEGLDTLIFMSVGFLGIMDLSTLLKVMFFQYCWKLGYEIVLTPITCAVIRRMRPACNLT